MPVHLLHQFPKIIEIFKLIICITPCFLSISPSGTAPEHFKNLVQWIFHTFIALNLHLLNFTKKNRTNTSTGSHFSSNQSIFQILAKIAGTFPKNLSKRRTISIFPHLVARNLNISHIFLLPINNSPSVSGITLFFGVSVNPLCLYQQQAHTFPMLVCNHQCFLALRLIGTKKMNNLSLI